jgi:hypothetical protein
MDELTVKLTADELSRVGQMPCEQAAVEICKIHLKRRDPDVTFLTPGKGADLRLRSKDGTETDIEVKGTEATGIAWAQLKVSSQQSRLHDSRRAARAVDRKNGFRTRDALRSPAKRVRPAPLEVASVPRLVRYNGAADLADEQHSPVLLLDGAGGVLGRHSASHRATRR